MLHLDVDLAVDVDERADRLFKLLDRSLVATFHRPVGRLQVALVRLAGQERSVDRGKGAQAVGDLGHGLVFTIGEITPPMLHQHALHDRMGARGMA